MKTILTNALVTRSIKLPQAIARLTATSRPSRTVISKTRRWSFSNLVIPENTALVVTLPRFLKQEFKWRGAAARHAVLDRNKSTCETPKPGKLTAALT